LWIVVTGGSGEHGQGQAGKQRIILCMDGTRQTLNQARHTNIAIIARSAAHKETLPDGTHIHQHVIYSQGVAPPSARWKTRASSVT
jgi:uncharacterized protein (DUF2235 family)